LSVTFEESDLDLIASTEEISVETRSRSGEVHRTIVWPVVRDGVVYLRSYKGQNGRWYREAVADPAIALVMDGRRWPARAVPATDVVSVEACSAALRAKYPRDDSLEAMLVPDVLATTLRIEPAPANDAAPANEAAPAKEPATTGGAS
jgi:hypothetical protein